MNQPTIPGVSKGVRPKRGQIVAQLAEIIRRMALGDIGPGAMATELRELADALESKGPAAEPVGPKSQEMLDAWGRLFSYWQKAAGKDRAKKTSDRRQKVIARMRAGYSEAAIRRAIDGCVSDEWHAEKGKVELVYICRNDSTLEGFIDKAGGMPDAGERLVPDEVTERLEALEAKAMEALERGDDDRYAALQQQIARIQRDGE